MRLVTFDTGKGPRLGAQVSGKIVDLAIAAGKSGMRSVAKDMLTLIQGGEDAWNTSRQVISWVEGKTGDFIYEQDAVNLKAPLSNPPKLLCVALNYKEHAKESGLEVPDEPMFFSKFPSVIIGPGEAVKIPKQSEQVDYEVELALVVGRGGRHIPESQALEHVFGYTIMNDISCRDYQRKWSQWLVGKSFDTFAPMGPAIVTADEVPDPQNFPIKLSIDGEVMQDSNTSDMIFKIPRLIAFASSILTLEAGDVFMTGTPPGVGAGRTPPRWLRPGETIKMEISELGTLINPVEAE